MKRFLRRLSRNQKGQTATEYMLIIAVIVIAVVVIGKTVFVNQFFKPGVEAAGGTVKEWLTCKPGDATCEKGE